MPDRDSVRQNLKDLAELTGILISAGDLPQLYAQLTERIAQITGAEACLIANYEKSIRRFATMKPHYGLREKDNTPLDYEVTPEFHKLWNFRTNGTLLSNQPSEDNRVLPYFVENYSVRSVIMAPMIVEQELLGIIAIINKRDGFTEFDSYLASIIAYQTGIILTNARLRNEEKRRTAQISLLNETAKQINSSLILDDILNYAIGVVQKALRMNEVGIYMPSEDGSILDLRACSGPCHRQIKEQGYVQSSQIGFLGFAFREGKTIYSNDCSTHSVFLPHPLIPTKSEACIPVTREGKVLAILNVESNETGAFSSGDMLTLEMLADQLAIAFHNAMSYETARKHNEQMLLLSELISELALILDRDRIAKTTVERIKHRFQYYFVAIGWIDQEKEVIHRWYYLPKFEVLKDTLHEIPVTKGLTGKAVQTGKSILVRDTSKSQDYFNMLEQVRSELVIPVRIGDSIVAVLDLESDRLAAFDESDQLIMEILAHALSTALQNADSYHRLERMNQQLANTARMKDEIVQIVAHDFRSPLTVIRGYMDYLLKKKEWKDEKQKEIMETVSLQAHRLQKLAEATLKASRLDSGDISFSYEKLDFTSFLRRLIPPWSEKHKFVMNTENDLPLIKADAGRLQEVMENLMSNAIKYSPDGGVIEIVARKVSRDELPPEVMPENPDSQATFLFVSVSDEGIGIPAEKKKLLFQRFTRIHEDRKMEGIGLGLYIAKKMVEGQGGRIWLEDKEKGACFCFAVPTYEEDISKENILIVDDDIHTLRLLHKTLSEIGLDVLTATEGREALDKVARFHPRLIVIDVLMPGISGLELVRRLKESPETAKIPVIVFTGKSDFRLPPEFQSIPIISKNAGIQTLKSHVAQVFHPHS